MPLRAGTGTALLPILLDGKVAILRAPSDVAARILEGIHTLPAYEHLVIDVSVDAAGSSERLDFGGALALSPEQ